MHFLILAGPNDPWTWEAVSGACVVAAAILIGLSIVCGLIVMGITTETDGKNTIVAFFFDYLKNRDTSRRSEVAALALEQDKLSRRLYEVEKKVGLK